MKTLTEKLQENFTITNSPGRTLKANSRTIKKVMEYLIKQPIRGRTTDPFPLEIDEQIPDDTLQWEV